MAQQNPLGSLFGFAGTNAKAGLIGFIIIIVLAVHLDSR